MGERVRELEEALRRLLAAADLARDVCNTGLMDEAIAVARAALGEARDG